MTTVSDNPATGLSVSAPMPVLAKGLLLAFDAPLDQLRKLGAQLSDGNIQLTQLFVRMAPYVGPSAQQVQVLRQMSSAGHRPASRELRAIADFHQASRYTPFLQFVAQFPRPWQLLLMRKLRDSITEIDFKTGPGGFVVQVAVSKASTLHEYGLRAFKLPFAQMLLVAEWIRENPDQLPTAGITMPTADGRNGSDAARYAALMTFFDNFPEKMRDLLAAKARAELTSIRFERGPTGEIVLWTE